jgi:sugar phosphate isomerase/epimerase
MKLREAVGPSIGANFDPSHLFWQGIDPVKAIRYLGEKKAMFHFHAKDTAIDSWNSPINGNLDTVPYTEMSKRSWLFRTVGYGHGYQVWKDMVSALRMVGYDHVLSIEHEDALTSIDEGFGKAVEFLKEVVLEETMGAAWWTD